MLNIPSRWSQEASVCAFALSEDNISTDAIHISHDINDAYIRRLHPSVPVAVLKPENVFKKSEEFVKAFTGDVMYAVKCNPDEVFLKAIYKSGVRHFDVASIGEIRSVRHLFEDAHLYFMHPIKAPEAIREAYINHNVRAFVLDYDGELEKIIDETNGAPDLELFVRIAVPKDKPGADVATDFSSKFGAKYDEAVALLKSCRPHCVKLGVSFHVGTQCHDPEVYSKAVKFAAKVIADSGVQVDVLDVGGGFPAELDTAHPVPRVQAYTETIATELKACGLDHLDLLCEVGRGLVACGGSLVVRVEGRKGDLLYLNDGTYGGLFEAGGSIGLPYPAKLIRREERDEQGALKGFRFAGPTCDSVDMMNGPFMLPDDVQVGDWIKLEQLGAYGEVSRTNFNGFGSVQKVIVGEEVKAKGILNSMSA